ncbi:Gfo/Idh/MocA family protein [Meridianimarinicoccus sp. RP-17]|uniref:Gfo/Idh/MocA family protein n=1 Tax=Meridianimarinicoccus zhengii TaxID=2056810 RepID=UPI000DACD3F3|nr:Gfo/Idh/MocA family oxidoreductase [Phycocomes zhengii]
MNKIRFAVVGCGYVADYYMRTAANHPDVEIVRGYDRSADNARRFTAYWNVPATDDADAFYDGLAVDAVLNLTNPDSHYAVTRDALTRGFPVYSEKPLAMEVPDIFALRDLARDKGLALASAPCNHLSEVFAATRDGLQAGHVGRPLLAYAEMDDNFIARTPYETWINPSGAPWPFEDEFAVGCTLEHAGYYLTWLIALFGSVRAVHAFGALCHPGKPVPEGRRESPDFTVACLEFDSGMTARLTCGVVAPKDHRLQVFGDAGTLEVEDSWFYDSPVSYRRWLRIRRKFLLTPWRTRLPVAKSPVPLPKTGSAAMDFIRGPIEMVSAARDGRTSRLPMDFCVHFNEVALAIHQADTRRAVYEVQSRLEDHAPLAIAAQAGRSSVLEDRLIPVAERLIGLVKK